MTDENPSAPLPVDRRMIVRQFADGDHKFLLGYDQLIELEEMLDVSAFYALAQMLRARNAPIKTVREVIRIALIGGGMGIYDALAKVRRYVEQRPAGEHFSLACEILEAGIFGSLEWHASPEGIADAERQQKAADAIAPKIAEMEARRREIEASLVRRYA